MQSIFYRVHIKSKPKLSTSNMKQTPILFLYTPHEIGIYRYWNVCIGLRIGITYGTYTWFVPDPEIFHQVGNIFERHVAVFKAVYNDLRFL